jgi:hypothetical protein
MNYSLSWDWEMEYKPKKSTHSKETYICTGEEKTKSKK